jgi:putative spermidine/putrescine transport system ATP-binding protein
VVMDHGRVQQVGPPLEIYREPANAFVADFIGLSNLLKGTLHGGMVRIGSRPVRPARVPAGLAEGSHVTLSIRPEEAHVRPANEPGENRLPAEVAFIRDLGASVEITVHWAGHELLAVMTPRERPDVVVGSEVALELPAEACVVLPA